jgi:hypothetical protein
MAKVIWWLYEWCSHAMQLTLTVDSFCRMQLFQQWRCIGQLRARVILIIKVDHDGTLQWQSSRRVLWYCEGYWSNQWRVYSNRILVIKYWDITTNKGQEDFWFLNWRRWKSEWETTMGGTGACGSASSDYWWRYVFCGLTHSKIWM